MPRILAIEWDAREVRVVAANARAGGLTVDQMFNVPLAAGEGEAVAPALGPELAAALAERRLGKSPTVFTLGRSQVELKHLTLPPAPDEELPEMVRLQAAREFTSLGDEWPLDFLPLTDDPSQPTDVLAAAASPKTMQQVRGACETAGLELTRVALRPMAAASLFLRQSEAGRHTVRLLIDLLPGEADLTVIVDRRVVFTRTARLGGDVLAAGAEARPLIAEIRRTLAAVHSQLQNRRVEAIFLFGSTPAHEALAKRIQEELSLSWCQAIDPLGGVTLDRELKHNPPADAGRYAALVGLLADEAAEATPALDFLNPRRPPPPPSRKREYALAGLVACAVLLLIGVVVLFFVRRLDNQIAKLNEELKDYKGISDQHAEAQKKLIPFEDWLASSVVWLDEWLLVERKLPRGDKVMATRMTMRSEAHAGERLRTAKNKGRAPPRSGGGELEIHGVAKSDVQQSDLRWQDEHRDIRIPVFKEDGKNPLYRTTFQAVIQIGPREPDFTPRQEPAKKAPAKAPTPQGKPPRADISKEEAGKVTESSRKKKPEK